MGRSNPQSEPDDSSNIVQKLEHKAQVALTVVWQEIEAWQRDNHFITSGYRPSSNSYWKSAASLGYLHNESVNIYTHLVGAVAAAVAGIVCYHVSQPRFEKATAQDVMVFSCYFLGAITCLGMSATYHTISNHSELVAKFGNKLDYIGIVVLIWGSFVSGLVVEAEEDPCQRLTETLQQIPSIYYGFSADPALVRLYWTMVRPQATLTRCSLPSQGIRR